MTSLKLRVPRIKVSHLMSEAEVLEIIGEPKSISQKSNTKPETPIENIVQPAASNQNTEPRGRLYQQVKDMVSCKRPQSFHRPRDKPTPPTDDPRQLILKNIKLIETLEPNLPALKPNAYLKKIVPPLRPQQYQERVKNIFLVRKIRNFMSMTPERPRGKSAAQNLEIKGEVLAKLSTDQSLTIGSETPVTATPRLGSETDREDLKSSGLTTSSVIVKPILRKSYEIAKLSSAENSLVVSEKRSLSSSVKTPRVTFSLD